MKTINQILLLIALLMFTCCTEVNQPVIHNDTKKDTPVKIIFKNAERFSSITPNRDNGKIIFKKNCAVCHRINDQTVVGPGMRNIMNRIPHEDKLSWLANYILNSKDTLFAKDAYIIDLKNEYSSSMTTFIDFLSDQEVVDVIDYIKNPGIVY